MLMQGSELKKIKSGSHIHLMGICGTAMASLAGLLKDRGFKVTGSDSNPYPPMSTQLENLKIPVVKGYSAANLNPRPDFVIVGNVISANNPEAEELMRLNIPYTSLPMAMGEFIIDNKSSILIAGTHGKTTTTSLMSWIGEVAGYKPGFLIGGIPKNFEKSFRNPEGDFFVIEGDEYDTAFFAKVPKFLFYKPKHVVLTSIEFDHADIYKDLSAVKSAFEGLIRLIPADGTFVFCANDKNIQSLLSVNKCKNSFSYGIGEGDYQAVDLKVSEKGTTFDVVFKHKKILSVLSNMGGNYNVLNVTATVAIGHQLGWDLSKVAQAISQFSGVKRRQEILGEPGGVLVIEDFAHHPTAVRETIKGILARYKGRKLFSVFEPRSATSRRKVFQKDYVDAFAGSGEVLIAEAFDQSKIAETDRFSTSELVSDMRQKGLKAAQFKNVDDIVSHIRGAATTGDMVLVMSNGGFDGIYGKLMTALLPK